MKTYAIGKETMPRELRNRPPVDADGYYAVGNELSGSGEPVWAYPSRSSALRAIKRNDGYRLNLWKAVAGNWVLVA